MHKNTIFFFQSNSSVLTLLKHNQEVASLNNWSMAHESEISWFLLSLNWLNTGIQLVRKEHLFLTTCHPNEFAVYKNLQIVLVIPIAQFVELWNVMEYRWIIVFKQLFQSTVRSSREVRMFWFSLSSVDIALEHEVKGAGGTGFLNFWYTQTYCNTRKWNAFWHSHSSLGRAFKYYAEMWTE